MNIYVQQLKEEYEMRLRVAERSLHDEKERRRQLGFQYKQLEAQLRKVQRDNESMEKQLKIMRKCASCSHLDQRSKSYNALNELLHGSMAALEPNVIASVNAPSHDDELKAVKIANNNLQQCVDKLQSMLLQKEREALVTEKCHSNAIWEREQQISRLQKEANQHTETKLKVLLREKTELLNRINCLEKENKENHNVVRNEPQNTTHLANTPKVFENDVNQHCEHCRNRLKNRSRMTSGKAIESSNFVNIDPDDLNQLKVKEAAVEKLRLLSSYEKLFQRCESLETELGKRRKAEHDIIKKISQNGQIVSNVDVVLMSHLKDELDKANEKIVSLEKELTLAKRTIYENKEFVFKAPRQIEMLESDKKELTHIIDNQIEQLTHFEDQLRAVNKEKEALQRKNTELESAGSLAVQEKLEQLKIIEMQRKKLSVLEEKQIEKTKAHDAQIETYQQLIKQKEDERGALIAELCAVSRLEAPLHDSINEIENHYANENRELLKEVRELNHEKQMLFEKITCLENELQSMKDQLSLKTEEIEKEVLLKNSMHDDLAKARTMLLEKEAQIFDLNNELKVAEVKIMKLETELANSADRLQVEQITGNTLKITVEELEDLLQEKSAELITSAQERQRCTIEMQKMKELKYDLETKLTLQGRELKEAREKLVILKKKIRELELETMNPADKSLHETPVQEESSKSSTPATTMTKSPTSTTTS